MVKIAVFASGQGSNTVNLINYFRNNKIAQVALVISNSSSAQVVQHAMSLKVETMIIDDVILKSDALIVSLQEKGIGFIVLAGFLKLIPVTLISAYKHCSPNLVVKECMV